MDENTSAPEPEKAASPHRRTVLKGAAWSVPIVAAAVAVPAQAVSCAPLRNVTRTVSPSGGARGDESIVIPNRDRLKEVQYVIVGGAGRGGGANVQSGHDLGQGGAGRRIIGTIPAALLQGSTTVRLVAGEMGQSLRGGYGYTNGGAAAMGAANERFSNGGSGGGSSGLGIIGTGLWIIAGGGGGGGGGQVSGNRPYGNGAKSIVGDPETNNYWGNGGAVGSTGQWGTSGEIASWGNTWTGARWSGIRGGAGGGIGGGQGAGGMSPDAAQFEFYGAGNPGNNGNGGRGGFFVYDGLRSYMGGGGGGGYAGGGGGHAYQQADTWTNGVPSGSRIYGGSGGGGGSSYIPPELASTRTSQDAPAGSNGYVTVTFVYEPCPA